MSDENTTKNVGADALGAQGVREGRETSPQRGTWVAMFHRGPLIHSASAPSAVATAVAWLSGILLCATITLLVIGVCSDGKRFSFQLKLLGLLWAIAPPVWFWCEYYYLWDRAECTFDKLKHNQALSAAIWLATLGSIAAYLKLWH